MESLLHISTPYTEPWVAWLMLALLIGLGAVNVFRPGLFQSAFASLPTTKERDSIFVGSGTDNRSELVLLAYSILLIALTMQWALGAGDFHFGRYAQLVGLAAAMHLVRWVMQQIVRFTFFEPRELVTFDRHYHYLLDCLMCCFYPVTLFALFCPADACIAVARILLLVLLSVAGILLVYKMLACFRFRLEALILLPLYLVTVEVLPILGMVYVARIVIAN